MENEKLFEFMTKMYSEMQDGFKGVNGRLDKVEGRLGGVEGRLDRVEGRLDRVEGRLDTLEGDVKSLKKTVLHIEQDHGRKLEVIFDGLTQHTDQLNRIEEEVRRHDEIILRRAK